MTATPNGSSFFDLEGDHLRSYQKAAIFCFLEGIAAGHKRQIIQKPTGTGKTITALALAKKLGRTVWFTHREELIDQPIETLASLWPECQCGIVKQEKDGRLFPNIVFASIQTAVRRLDLDWGKFALAVVDEAHHAAAKTYKKVLNHFTAQNPTMVVAGLTATPTRGDRKNLSEAGFTAFAYRMSIPEAIRHGFLVPYTAERIVLPRLDLSTVPIVKGDFDPERLQEELEKAHAAEETAKAVAAHAATRKTIVFTASVEQARKTCEELQKLGVVAGWVCGETPAEERRKTLRALKSDSLQVVANAMVLTEGFDDPSLGAVAVARPTKSKGLYIQMVGRALRIHPTKKDALILDLVGAHELHGMQIAARLADPQTKADKVAETENLPIFGEFAPSKPEPEPEEEEKEPEKIEGKIVSRYLDAATTGKVQSIASSRQNWIECAPGLYTLPCGGTNNILLYEERGKWRAEVGTRKIIEASDLSLVQGTAEDYARVHGALGLSFKRAMWRSREPSEAQMNLLHRLGIFYAEGTLTQGEVSDLILATQVRRQHRQKIQRILS